MVRRLSKQWWLPKQAKPQPASFFYIHFNACFYRELKGKEKDYLWL